MTNVNIGIISLLILMVLYLLIKLKAADKNYRKIRNLSDDSGGYDQHKHEIMTLISKRNIDHKVEIQTLKNKYESLLQARKEKDDEYDFIVGRYHNESNLRKYFEENSTKERAKISSLTIQLRQAIIVNRRLKYMVKIRHNSNRAI